MSTARLPLNSTWRTARREASGCFDFYESRHKNAACTEQAQCRPIGPQRTNSNEPRPVAIRVLARMKALCAAPLYLLLLTSGKERAARPTLIVIATQGPRIAGATATTRTKTTEQITEKLAQTALKHAIGQSSDISRKSKPLQKLKE